MHYFSLDVYKHSNKTDDARCNWRKGLFCNKVLLILLLKNVKEPLDLGIKEQCTIRSLYFSLYVPT